MSILLNKENKIIVQGITGQMGSFHTKSMMDYGSNIVAGVTPFKGGENFNGIPIFNTVKEVKEKIFFDTSIIFVPSVFAADAIIESIKNEVSLIVCITEGIPVLDMMKIKKLLNNSKSILIGPNCPGIITPGESKLGIMPSSIHLKGNAGIVSRSGTLTYEAVHQLSSLGIGQSTCIGIGGDPISGLNFLDVIKMFNTDPFTKYIVMIGEIGGNKEEEAAIYIKNNVSKPIVGYIAGISAPSNKKMGHAGAITKNDLGSAKNKISFLRESGVTICESPAEIGITLKNII